MTRGTVSRSDLALLISGADARTMPRELAAELCGFDYAPALQSQPPPKRKKIPRREGVSPAALLQEDELPPPAPSQRQLEFWHPACARYKSPEDRARERQPPDWVENARFDPDEMLFEGAPLAGQPLIRWSRLWPFLRQVLGRRHPGRRPDVPRLVRGIAEGRPLRRLPRVARRGWHPEVHVLVDRRLGLATFWDDYDWLLHRLTAMRGSLGLSIHHLEREGDELFCATSDGERRPYRMGGQPLIIALGDLGQYEGGAASAAWHALGRRLRRGGASPVALCPCPRNRWAPAMTRVWTMFCWERTAALSRRGQRADVITADERAAHEAAQRNGLHAVLRLLSPAVRIERGLIRDVRCLLPAHEADAGLEYDAFQSSYTYGQGFGFSIHPEKLKALRAELAGHVTPALIVEAVRLIFRHHAYCSRVFHPQEVLGLLDILPDPHKRALTEAGLIHPDSHAEARAHCQRLVAALWRGSYGAEHGPMLAYAGRALDRLQASALTAQEMQALWRLAHPGSRRGYPPHVNPGDLLWMEETPKDAPLRRARVVLGEGMMLDADRGFFLDFFHGRQNHVHILLEHLDGTRHAFDLPWDARHLASVAELRGSKTIELHSDHQYLTLARMARPAWAARMWYSRDGMMAQAKLDARDHLFAWRFEQHTEWPVLSGAPMEVTGRWQLTQVPPPWASRLFVDDHGLAAEFHVRSVPFVLRWIPPGRFFMGSPEGEPGRYDNEGPRHEVRISRGFWMGDAPVTQEQWRAVVEAAGAQPGLINRLLGKKTLNPAPSRFQGPPDLPVEQVSWKDSSTFCRLLDALLPDGPGFRLPTEAQWEYACRAQAGEAPYDGAFEIRGANDAPVLDPFAWYGGNSGLDLEVTNPYDSKDWPDKQHPHTQAGTHRVKLKAPNPFGLHDMLGNVLEWCRDTWDAEVYAKRAAGVADPFVNEGESASRVVRGGSWDYQARGCRAAFRDGFEPASRWSSLGLRLSAGQEPAEPQAAAERSEAMPENRAERDSQPEAARRARKP